MFINSGLYTNINEGYIYTIMGDGTPGYSVTGTLASESMISNPRYLYRLKWKFIYSGTIF